MGFLFRFWRYFQKNSSQGKEQTVMLSHLLQWVQEQREAILEKEKLLDVTKEYLTQLRYHKERIIALSQRLEGREKLYSQMKGIVLYFTFPESLSLEEVLDANELLAEKLELLLEMMEQSSGLQESSFARELLEINTLRQQFEKKVLESGMRNVIVLQEKAIALQTIVAHRERAQQELMEKTQRLLTTEAKANEKRVELEELQKHPSFSKSKVLREQRNYNLQQVHAVEEEISRYFQLLLAVFQRYLSVEPQQRVVLSYVENPHKALLQDEGLQIVHVLRHCKALLQTDLFSLQGDKLQEVISVVDNGCNGYLHTLQKEYVASKGELEDARQQSVDTAFVMKLQDAEYRFQHFQMQVERLQARTEELEQELEEHEEHIAREQALFCNLVKIGFNRSVVISL